MVAVTVLAAAPALRVDLAGRCASRRPSSRSQSKYASARPARCRAPRRNHADVVPQVTSGGSPFAARCRVGSSSYNDPVNRTDPTGLRPGDCDSAADDSACRARVTWTKIVRDVTQSRPMIGVVGRCLGADVRIPAVALHGSVCIAADRDQVGYVENASVSYLGSIGADGGVSMTAFASNARDVWELSGTAVCASVSASAIVVPGLVLAGTVCAGIRSNYDLSIGDQVTNRSNPQVPKTGSEKHRPGSAAAGATAPEYDCRNLNDAAPDNACEFWLKKLLNEKAFNGVWVANYGPGASVGLPLGFDVGVGNAWVQSPPHFSYAFLRSLIGL